ncbi:S8 family serine peptidase [Sporosarcina koreensis]|uniref:S8 family serine peptidase n=1 Tax=Sporosarcina koreensis TaxID=334735 RepID=A0ABW0U3M5_9BACL
MYSKKVLKFLSTMLAVFMVLSLLTPMQASANTTAQPFKERGTDESIHQMKMAVAQQLELLKNVPTLHKDLQGLKGEENVDVIIQLSEDAVALAEGKQKINNKPFTAAERTAALTKVKQQQTAVKKEMYANNLIEQEGFSYEIVLNGFAATVKAKNLEKLLSIPGITSVEPDIEVYAMEDTASQDTDYEAMMNTSISFLGIERIWNKGFKGNGIKVGVLDTGIDYNHPEFEGIYKGGWNFISHANSADYTKPRDERDPYETTPSERPAAKPEFNANGSSFYTSHGTHVAGTIAALGKNEYGISGIAPQVDLHAYRVLGAYGSGSNAGVIAGINKAVEEGMDIINLSLGGGSNTSVTADTIAINNAMLAGTLAVMATGNSGPGRGTIGTPAAAALGVAVGNTTNPETQFEATVDITAGAYSKESNMKLMGTTFGANLSQQLAGEFEIVAIPGVGKPSDYAGLDVAGKVVLVSRGEIAFVDKIAAAKEAGAAAMLIHNFGGGTNAPGPSGTFLGDAFEFIPAFDMSQTEGDALRAALAAEAGKVSFDNFTSKSSAGDEVNNSSSRGPTTPNFDIKPDVTAPGTNIMSTIPMYGKDNPAADYSKAYTRKTGTSMATPHIAGIAALIMNANPDWTPFDVKVALSNTAKVLDTAKYDVFAQGPGRVQPYDAAFPKALAYAEDRVVSDGVEVDNHKGTVTFGNLEKVKDGDISVTKQIRVKKLSGGPSNFEVSVQVTKAFKDAKLTIDKPTFTLNGEQLLNVTLTASKSTTATGNEFLGYIHLRDGQTELSLPFAVDFSPKAPATGMGDYALTEKDLSFNGDGVKDVGRLEFTLLSNVATNYIELWDIQDPEGGYYEDGYIGYLHSGSSLAAGSYYLEIDGEYAPWGGTGLESIPDGIYTVDFTALNLGAGPTIIEAWDGPLFVKSTSAVIESEGTHVADAPTYTFSGNLVDKYIDYQELLAEYGLGYNLNTKLATTYEAADEAGNIVSSGPVNLAQDGTFTFEVTGLANGVNTVTIFVEDAAGNKSEASFDVVYDAAEEPGEPAQTLSVTPDKVTLKVGDTKQLAVTSTQKEDKVEKKKDVTKDAAYTGYDEKVIKVVEGKIEALAVGETAITVTYGEEDVTVTVTVEKKDVVLPPYYPPYTPPVDPKPEPKPEEKPVTKPVIFTDIANTFAANEIKVLAARGIIQGKTETEFAPNAQITRAEFAVFLARALNLPTKEYEGKFSDVIASKKWAYAGVEAAARAGIVNGTTDGKFNPDAPIKREEIAAMVVRAIEYQNKEKLANLEKPANFGDHGSIGNFAIDAVYKATSLGVIKGNEGNFMPKNNATRAEAAVMLYRALDTLQLLD